MAASNSYLFAVLVLLAGCSPGAALEADENAISNQAESLERGADATTDTAIKQIEDDAAQQDADNASNAAEASD
jgi:hypothetical protein